MRNPILNLKSLIFRLQSLIFNLSISIQRPVNNKHRYTTKNSEKLIKVKMRKFILIIYFFLFSFSLKADWVNVTNEIINLNINALTGTGSYIFAGNNQYIYRSSNNGDNWQQIYNLKALALASNGNYIFHGYENGVGRSTNYGNNWSYAGLNQWTLSLLTNGNYVYAGCFWPIPGGSTNRGVWISSNFGANWSQTSLNDKDIYALTITGSYLFAGGQGIYLSTNNGSNWSLSLLGSSWALSSNGNYIYTGTDGSPYGVYKSTNYGTNWTQTSLNNVGVHALAIYNGYVFAGTSYGFYVSSDSGATWAVRNEGFSGTPYIKSFCIHNNFLFAGPPGVWRRPLSELVGIKTISQEVPEGYLLYQNYPNPFNPITNIKYQITNKSYIELKIFDILGRQIETLVSKIQKPGSYEAEWDGEDYPSGVYFYRLEAGTFVDSKKMVLVK